MTNINLIQVTLDNDSDKEVAMVRIDKKLDELMDESPSSRWDPDYWHSKYDLIDSALVNSGYRVIGCSEIIKLMTNGNRDREWASPNEEKIRFIQVINVLNTGIDFTKGDKSKLYAKKNGIGDPGRSRLKLKDIVLLSGATGSLGRCTVVNYLPEESNVSQDVNIIRLKDDSEIMPEYLVLFMLSKFGQSQLEKFSKGVSGQIKVTFDHIKSIKIPVLPAEIQENLAKSYDKILNLHNEATKKCYDSDFYKQKLKTASKLLDDLVKRVETTIIEHAEETNDN